MILSDRDLRERLTRGDLRIEPLGEPEVQVQPASVDLRLAGNFLRLRDVSGPVDSYAPSAELYEEILVRPGEAFTLGPADFVLGSTIERVCVPFDLVGRVEGRSSLGRLAIIVHATAGFIDPGFEGEITLELSNLGRVPVLLHPGMRICQVVFHQMSGPAERPYGPLRGSKYQDQAGPTESRMRPGR